MEAHACCERLKTQLNENEGRYIQLKTNFETKLKKTKDVNKDVQSTLQMEEAHRGLIERMV